MFSSLFNVKNQAHILNDKSILIMCVCELNLGNTKIRICVQTFNRPISHDTGLGVSTHDPKCKLDKEKLSMIPK